MGPVIVRLIWSARRLAAVIMSSVRVLRNLGRSFPVRAATVLSTAFTLGCQQPEPQARDSSSAGAHSVATADTTSPSALVQRYYAAIEARDYAAAYGFWGRSGAASGQSRDKFESGFASTAHVKVTVGDSIRVEGAAGSQYATVPVVVNAVLRSGERQRFEGSYTLRRVMVDGATPDQRRWHIESAQLHPA